MVSSSFLNMSASKSVAKTLVQFFALLSVMSIFFTLYWYSIMDDYGMESEFLSALSVEAGILVICCMADHGLEKNRRVYLVPFFVFLFLQYAWALIYTAAFISDFVGLVAMGHYYDITKWDRNYQFNFFTAKVLMLMYLYFVKLFSSLYVEMGEQDSKTASLSPNSHYIKPKKEVC